MTNKKTNTENSIKRIAALLCAATVLTGMLLTGCRGTETENPAGGNESVSDTQKVSDTVESDTADTTAPDDGTTVLGEGAHSFSFSVTDPDGKKTDFTINTDKETVGDALLELGMIEGEDGAYGLYVKTVNGVTVDYDKDGKYWAFYVDGSYAMSGVDSTEITDGAAYAFIAE